MAVLNVRDLSMSFVERNLFSNISFDLEQKDKIGLVGANGVGKTTLFKILTGELEPSSGEVFKSKEAVIGYMQQHGCKEPKRFLFDELLTVFDNVIKLEKELEQIAKRIETETNSDNLDKLVAQQIKMHEDFHNMGGLTYKSRTRASLLGLGFNEADFEMEVGKLSGGQLSKLNLAKLLLSGANLLLLDEPTNHLDIDSVEWLENFIKDFNGSVLIISHDRYFLDSVTNKTIEIAHKKAVSYKGNYSDFMKKKEKIEEDIRSKYENDIKEIKRVEGIIEQQKRWGRERNFITAASKQKQVDRLKEDIVNPDREIEHIKFRFEPKRVSGNDVLITDSLSKSFGDKKLFSNLSLHLRRKERVFLLGANGSGKTTLFRVLMNREKADRGCFNFGSNVDIGYFDQVQANLDLNKTPLDEVWDTFPHMTETQVRTSLGAFLFKGDDVFKPQNTLSGGERARVALLKLMLAGSNTLLLDEPTNHLDTWSREALEETLSKYEGTMLIVSHDRYFINKMADRILYLDKDGVTEYLGNYDYYAEKRKNNLQCVKKDEKSVDGQEKVNEYKLRKELASAKRKLATQLAKAEKEVEQIEEKIDQTQKLLADESVTADYQRLMQLTNEMEELRSKQEEAFFKWEEAQSELEKLDC